MKVLAVFLCCILLTSCGSGPVVPPDQRDFYDRWASENTTDAQIDALRYSMPRPVQAWRATVTNVREEGDFTIIETAYRNQNYYLWMFETEARNQSRQLDAQTEIEFSGELIQELSMTRDGARDNPEFGVYASQVTGGGIEISQTAEGISNQHALDRQAQERAREKSDREDRDSSYESRTIALCKEIVLEKLSIPVSGEFSWFQSRTRKESDTRWVYADEVSFVTDSGEDASARFVCSVTVRGDNLEAQVQFLN